MKRVNRIKPEEKILDRVEYTHTLGRLYNNLDLKESGLKVYCVHGKYEGSQPVSDLFLELIKEDFESNGWKVVNIETDTDLSHGMIEMVVLNPKIEVHKDFIVNGLTDEERSILSDLDVELNLETFSDYKEWADLSDDTGNDTYVRVANEVCDDEVTDGFLQEMKEKYVKVGELYQVQNGNVFLKVCRNFSVALGQYREEDARDGVIWEFNGIVNEDDLLVAPNQTDTMVTIVGKLNINSNIE